MRRRALESELKKFSDRKPTAKLKRQTSTQQSSCSSASDEECTIEVYVSDSEKLDFESQGDGVDKSTCVPVKQPREKDSHDGGVNKVRIENDTMDLGELLEMKLRQKALQSLLLKRQTSTTQ